MLITKLHWSTLLLNIKRLFKKTLSVAENNLRNERHNLYLIKNKFKSSLFFCILHNYCDMTIISFDKKLNLRYCDISNCHIIYIFICLLAAKNIFILNENFNRIILQNIVYIAKNNEIYIFQHYNLCNISNLI